MIYALILVFIVAYTCIALEEPLRINKSGSALIGAGLLWGIYALASGLGAETIEENLSESLIATAQIAFFLMGAMTIVEVIDAHDGFEVVTQRVKAKSLSSLIWIIAFLAFFLSAVLDNLTTTIVMVSLARKLLAERKDRLLLVGLIVISANAGGAWSPIGDVTTTMLWIGGQVTTLKIIEGVFAASVVNAVVPLAIVTLSLRGRPVIGPDISGENENRPVTTTVFERNLMFFFGLGALLMVPVLKAVTHLPPFICILFGLGVLWAVGDIIHRDKDHSQKAHVGIANALTRIDMSAIVFFVGILLAVAVLEHTHVLASLAGWLDAEIGRLDVIVMLIGLFSAVIDNVPMVAAAMGMYDMGVHPPDSFLWEFMAYCAGTGGSILIIGSAAGVAAMSIEKVEFIWYAKRFAPLALLGYFAGAAVYILEFNLTH
jgi:Na+/H+ antiporter NhaD/arsenite permease-like protein